MLLQIAGLSFVYMTASCVCVCVCVCVYIPLPVTEPESKMVVAGDWGPSGRWADAGQMVQMFS